MIKNRRVGLVKEHNEKVDHEEVDAKPQEEDEPGSNQRVVVYEAFVNGAGLDEVLVHHEEAHLEAVEAWIGRPEQKVG